MIQGWKLCAKVVVQTYPSGQSQTFQCSHSVRPGVLYMTAGIALTRRRIEVADLSDLVRRGNNVDKLCTI